MKSFYVYLLEYPDGSKYVGKHVYRWARASQMFDANYWGGGNNVCYRDSACNEEAKKYDPRYTGIYPERTILEWCSDSESLRKCEERWINHFKDIYGFVSEGGRLLNQLIYPNDVRTDKSRKTHTPEWAAKVSETRKLHAMRVMCPDGEMRSEEELKEKYGSRAHNWIHKTVKYGEYEITRGKFKGLRFTVG